jgi:glycosyltransferase involved in cell wall biosynthesis
LTPPGPAALTATDISVLWVTEGPDRPTAECIIGILRAGVDVEVITGPDSPRISSLRDGGVPVATLKLRQRFDLGAIRELKRRLDGKRYDILHAFGTKALACSIQAARRRPIRIVTFRGYMGNLRSWYPPARWTFLHPRVDRIICGSNAIARYFLDHRMRIPREKIVTIYKGHELDWYRDAPTDLGTLGVPAGAFSVGFCGRDRPRKGIHVLIDSARYLPREYPIHFVLVGGFDKNRALEQRIRNSPARDRIHRVGFRTDAPQIAGACDVFALPSIDREGFSRAVVEAMAYGTPPIVSDVGGMPEMVEHGVSGLIVPQADPQALAAAIRDLYEHPEKRMELGRRARQRIGDVFTCRRSVRETIALYLELATALRAGQETASA